MSVLAGIEAEAAPSARPGNSLLLAGPLGTAKGISGSAQSNISCASRPCSESFRSRLQAQFASFEPGAEHTDETETSIAAPPGRSQESQVKVAVHSGPSGTSTATSSSSPSPFAGTSLLRWSLSTEKGDASAPNSIATAPHVVNAQARVPHQLIGPQIIGLQKSTDEQRTTAEPEAISWLGTTAHNSASNHKVNGTKREKPEPRTRDLASTQALSSTIDGLQTALLIPPIPVTRPTVATSGFEAQASAPHPSIASFSDSRQNSILRDSSTTIRSEVNFGVLATPAGRRLDLFGELTLTANASAPQMIILPDPTAERLDAGSTKQTRPAASISIDSLAQSHVASTVPQRRDGVDAPSASPNTDENMVPAPKEAFLSAEVGLENLQPGQTGENNAVSRFDHQVDSGAEINSIGHWPTPAAPSGLTAQSPLPLPAGVPSHSATLASQSDVQSAVGVAVPTANASALRTSPNSAVSSAGDLRRVPALTSAGNHSASVIAAKPSQAPVLGNNPLLTSADDVTQAQFSVSGERASVSNQIQLQSSEPTLVSPSRNVEQPVHDQTPLETVPAQSQASALIPIRSESKAESGQAAGQRSHAESSGMGKSAHAPTVPLGPVFYQNARPAEVHHPFEFGTPGLQPQIAAASGDPSSLVRDPAALHILQNSTQNSAGGSNGSAPSAAREAFTEIDNGAGPDVRNWTHIGSHRAEAGIEDPALGWIGVRADGSAGQVHATLMPGSADAAQALGGHMAGLSAYLTNIHTPVQSLRIVVPEGQEPASNTSSDQGQGTSQRSDQGASQNPGQDNPSDSSSNFNPTTSERPAAVRIEAQVFAGTTNQLASSTEFSGAHISVMA